MLYFKHPRKRRNQAQFHLYFQYQIMCQNDTRPPVKDVKETNPDLPPAGNGGPPGGANGASFGQAGPKYKRPNER